MQIPYYLDLISSFKEVPPNQEKPLRENAELLEHTFTTQYGSYRTIFFPMVGGAHSTQRFRDNGFAQKAFYSVLRLFTGLAFAAFRER